MLKLASWNVNSLKIRQEQVLAWLATSNTDILALQETKLTDECFPHAAFVAAGWHVVFAGQKTYNGVAVVSRYPLQDSVFEIAGFADPQRRILAVTVAGIRVINLYVPNGAAVGSDKYAYKLNWLREVTAWIAAQKLHYPKLAVVGDFNIAPADCDVHDPSAWQGSVLVSAEERRAFTEILNCGLQDSFRTLHPQLQSYSWWDYRAAAFRRNLGLRIDHILLSDPLQAICHDSGIDVEPRRAERPSDHAPVWVNLEI